MPLPDEVLAEATALFHDVRAEDIDPEVHAPFVIARVLDRGTLRSVKALLRFYGRDGDDRLVFVNLGRDLHWHPTAEPRVAPPPGTDWRIIFSSDDPQYGGSGTALLDTKHWGVPGHATVVLSPQPESEHPPET